MLPLVSACRQVCVLSHDLDATIRAYYEIAGIGPWAVWTPSLTDTKVRGTPTPFSMKLALAWSGDFMWEVVQPLDDRSIYAEVLRTRGEGMHHVLVDTADHEFEAALATFAARGCSVLMEGRWGSTDFAYVDTQATLGQIFELYRRAPGTVRPDPDYFYPHRPSAMPL